MRKIVVAGSNRQGRPSINIRHHRTTGPTPVHLTAIDTAAHRPPTLCFTRKHPKTTWVVPPVDTPFYWFDKVMVDKGLITAVPPDVFIVDRRRFKVIAQDWHIIGVGYTRWLVYELHPKLPKP